MSDNRNDIVSGLNQIFEFLGPHGGEITIEDDWDFSVKYTMTMESIKQGYVHTAVIFLIRCS